MNTPCDIAVLAERDLETLFPLFQAYQRHYAELTQAGAEETRRFLREHLSKPEGGFVLMARIAGEPVGFAAVYLTAAGIIARRIAHLGDLYVALPRIFSMRCWPRLNPAVFRWSAGCLWTPTPI
jgi:hypothetical protein